MAMRDDLKVALRVTLGEAARAHGFKGTVPNWRRSTPVGDWAILNIQFSTSSTATSARCAVNTAVAPEPWLRSRHFTLGRAPKTVTESLGLYRQRLHPTGAPSDTDTWWQISSPRQVDSAAADMARQLEARGWPVLTGLLDRDRMLEQVRAGDLGFATLRNLPGFFAVAEALLLMDSGPSEQLDEQLRIARVGVRKQQIENADLFEAWVREQAAAAAR